MAWTKTKTMVVAGVVLIALSLGVGYVGLFSRSHGRYPGKLKLPTGRVTPEMGFQFLHGVVLAADGSLWAWGDEDTGWPVLGLPGIQHTVSLRRIGKETDWVSVAVGTQHNLAIKSDGTLWGWGANFRCQLGDGTTTTRATPIPSAPGNDWVQAAASGVHSLAQRRDGTLWAWGDNWAGQLGIGTVVSSSIAVQVGSAHNWTKIWSHNVVNVGQQSDGSLWLWGSLTSTTNDVLLVPTRVSVDTNWVDVSFGDSEVFAIKSDGSLWVWGREAQIYTGATDTKSNRIPTRVGTDSDWKSGGCAHIYYHLFLKKDGSLWALDASADHNPRGGVLTPAKLKRIDLKKDFVAFATGRDNIGVALTRNGEVWTWGQVIGARAATDFIGREREPVIWEQPWQLSNIVPKDGATKK